MKLIQKIEELIDEEIHDQKNYAKMATELKESHPMLAQVLYNISTQEEGHATALHNEVVKIIEQHRKEHGEPPAAMMAVYDYLHKKHIEKAVEAKRYQDVFKST
jgi:sulfur relay (sulfurtransferase) DsrC/TusE family protein